MKNCFVSIICSLQISMAIMLSFNALGAVELTPSERSVLTNFDDALTQHATAAKAARSVSVVEENNLVNLARERRVIMKRLIQVDPQQAFALGIDRARRAQVTKAVQQELEENISDMGSLDVLIGRPIDGTQPPIIKHQATIQGKKYDVATWGSGLNATQSVRRS
jgi:hypothetical protein